MTSCAVNLDNIVTIPRDPRSGALISVGTERMEGKWSRQSVSPWESTGRFDNHSEIKLTRRQRGMAQSCTRLVSDFNRVDFMANTNGAADLQRERPPPIPMSAPCAADITQEMQTAYLDYAMSVIVARACRRATG